jgi:uncharacterized membrane protein YqgA involved in biofilm formation
MITIGAFLNAIGILLGAICSALRGANRFPPARRHFFRKLPSARPPFFRVTPRLVERQRNASVVPQAAFHRRARHRAGQFARQVAGIAKNVKPPWPFATRLLSSAETNSSRKMADGFNAPAPFYSGPRRSDLLGAVADGLSGYFYLLAVKAVMDGLAMTSFVKMFRWPAAMSAIPVFALLGFLTLVCQLYARPFLENRQLIDSVNAAAGLAACAVALVIFEVRKVELANFLPSLAVAPLLAWLLK